MQTLRDHIGTSFSKEENWVCVFFPGEKIEGKGEIPNEKRRSLCAEASDNAMNFPTRRNIVKLCFQILHQRHTYIYIYAYTYTYTGQNFYLFFPPIYFPIRGNERNGVDSCSINKVPVANAPSLTSSPGGAEDVEQMGGVGAAGMNDSVLELLCAL